ncbi:MazG-like family protein [Streptomyces sp. NPDC002671]
MTEQQLTPAAGRAELWSAVDELWDRLESTSTHTGTENVLLRVLKLSEEAGEVAQAVIGATGHNPRKGFSHTWDDVQAELCDVAITALVTLRSLTPDAREVFEAHLKGVRERPTTPPA